MEIKIQDLWIVFYSEYYKKYVINKGHPSVPLTPTTNGKEQHFFTEKAEAEICLKECNRIISGLENTWAHTHKNVLNKK